MQKQCGNCLKHFAEEKLDLHEIYCRRNIKPCPRCHQLFDKNYAAEHEQEFHQLVECQFCQVKFEEKARATHELSCSKRTNYCQYCELNIPLNDFHSHQKICGARTKLCGKCGTNVKLSQEVVHQVECASILARKKADKEKEQRELKEQERRMEEARREQYRWEEQRKKDQARREQARREQARREQARREQARREQLRKQQQLRKGKQAGSKPRSGTNMFKEVTEKRELPHEKPSSKPTMSIKPITKYKEVKQQPLLRPARQEPMLRPAPAPPAPVRARPQAPVLQPSRVPIFSPPPQPLFNQAFSDPQQFFDIPSSSEAMEAGEEDKALQWALQESTKQQRRRSDKVDLDQSFYRDIELQTVLMEEMNRKKGSKRR